MTAATLTKGPPRPLSERLFAAAAFVIGLALVLPVLTIIVLALFGFRWKRTQQMTTQYYWLYERTGPLTWRSKS